MNLANGSVGQSWEQEAAERVSQRDTATVKAALGDYGPEVQRRRIVPSQDRLSRVLFPRVRYENCLLWYLSKATNGPQAEEAVVVQDPAAMSRHIKDVARFFGADMVGICELKPQYVYTHAWEKFDEGSPAYGAPIDLSHRYAVVVARSMDYTRVLATPSFIDHAEVGQSYVSVAVTVCELAAYIRELGYEARAHHFSRQQVLLVPLAVEAGLGELGRCGYLVTPRFGPRVRLGAVTTNIPLAIDQPRRFGVDEFCEICKKCADNCPSGAIPRGAKTQVRGVMKWAIDAERCIRYWVAAPERWDSCSLCTAVCPWNQRDTLYHRMGVVLARRSGVCRKLLLWLDDLIRGRQPRPVVTWLGRRNVPVPRFRRG